MGSQGIVTCWPLCGVSEQGAAQQTISAKSRQLPKLLGTEQVQESRNNTGRVLLQDCLVADVAEPMSR